MPDAGVRLQLLVGPTIPEPAPFDVVDALLDVEVTNRDHDRDGFQLRFAVGRGVSADYDLVRSGVFEPPARVVVAVQVALGLQVLIDGVVLQHQVAPSNRPGESTLIVTGEDVSWHLDREQVNESQRDRDQGDSTIVGRVLDPYRRHGLQPEVTSTSDTRTDTESTSTQQETDREYVTRLARRHGFVFYVEPSAIPGRSTAHWGPENRSGEPQAPLSMNMGSATTVDQPMVFRFDALAGTTPQLFVVDPTTKAAVPISPPQTPLPFLSSQPAQPLRTTILRDTAALSPVDAALRALAEVASSADSVTASGVVDAVRYGDVLRARRLVQVRGAGRSYDGAFYVRSVTHAIRRGSYMQRFTLTRDGRGAMSTELVA